MRLFKFFICSCLLSGMADASSLAKPIIRQSVLSDVAHEEFSFNKSVGWNAIRAYQLFISPVDGDRCRMSPTCSTFGRQAIKKHGAVLGFILTIDRLMHEGNEYLVSPIVFDGKIYRTYDPVRNNTFWWKKNQGEENE